MKALILLTLLFLSGCASKRVYYPLEVAERVLIPKQPGWTVKDAQQEEFRYSVTWGGADGTLTRKDVSKREIDSLRKLVTEHLDKCSSPWKEYFDGNEKGYDALVVGVGCNEKFHFIKAIKGTNHLHLVERITYKGKISNTFDVNGYLSFLNAVTLCPVDAPASACVR